MTIPFISLKDMDRRLNWGEITTAIAEGHKLPKADVKDSFVYRGGDTLLTRDAWIDGLGIAVKAATVFPENPSKGESSINGGVMLLDNDTGILKAVIDFHLITKWKTAGDSLLAAKTLARPDSDKILIVGAGTVAQSMIEAYRSHWPKADIRVWNRTKHLAEDLGLPVMDDLGEAVHWADIICTATMASDPIIKGEWLRPGQHLDLIGAYRPDMREVDDATLTRAALFVDSRDTTIGHIGEIKDPMERGALKPEDILADYYDLDSGRFCRRHDAEITICKNGGGAHMDLMVADAIYRKWKG
ncbi:MAG: ornithine cyclodeaminase [Pseudomonadota bacterium]